MPPRVYRNQFDSLLQNSRELHDLTGPVATHGRRLEVYADNDQLFLKIPQVTVRPAFTRNALEQLLKMMNLPVASFMNVLERITHKAAARLLTDLLYWAFRADYDTSDCPVKKTRAVSPFICYPDEGEIGVLRGIWWSDFPRIYDSTICEIIEPFVGNLSIPLAVQTERKTMIFVVNESISISMRGATLHPGMFIENRETGTHRAKSKRLLWIPAHQMPVPMSSYQAMVEEPGIGREAWLEWLHGCLLFLDNQKKMVYEEKLLSLVDMDRWTEEWNRKDWDKTWQYLHQASLRVTKAQQQFTGKLSLTKGLDLPTKSKDAESSSSPTVQQSPR